MAEVNFDRMDDHVASITLNDVERLNAMGDAMAAQFAAGVEQWRQLPLRAIIVTGAGRAFSAGGHLDMLEARARANLGDNRRHMLEFYDSFLRLRTLHVPLIAAVNGIAVGAGAALASACDIRIVARNARIGFTFTRLGLHPGLGTTWLLPNIVGLARATDLLLTGRTITADEAFSIGWASRLSDDVLNDARAVANDILQGGPEATRALLQTLREPPASLQQALQREATAQSANYASAEYAEGIAALRQRRAPEWGV